MVAVFSKENPNLRKIFLILFYNAHLKEDWNIKPIKIFTNRSNRKTTFYSKINKQKYLINYN